MLMAKPVIAANCSRKLDFMDREKGVLVEL